ncbi:hypothetical protein GCM10010358_39070 [Streptomyces minutiscleroticus]|uniref:Uncharacterized protein n=1 Tax=Streptomyces minutiscleroticus TaxID=68238 RepID=A0A918U173_9ACTN|nr:hypothetical protein GCM10010358_39070 [Streptomyces minutiscleroticus]
MACTLPLVPARRARLHIRIGVYVRAVRGRTARRGRPERCDRAREAMHTTLDLHVNVNV